MVIDLEQEPAAADVDDESATAESAEAPGTADSEETPAAAESEEGPAAGSDDELVVSEWPDPQDAREIATLETRDKDDRDASAGGG